MCKECAIQSNHYALSMHRELTCTIIIYSVHVELAAHFVNNFHILSAMNTILDSYCSSASNHVSISTVVLSV